MILLKLQCFDQKLLKSFIHLLCHGYCLSGFLSKFHPQQQVNHGIPFFCLCEPALKRKRQFDTWSDILPCKLQHVLV